MARRADKKGVVLMLAFISLFFVVLTVLGFRGYRTAIAETEFLKNGTRVQAEIFEVYPLNEDWGCRYRYEDRKEESTWAVRGNCIGGCRMRRADSVKKSPL